MAAPSERERLSVELEFAELDLAGAFADAGTDAGLPEGAEAVLDKSNQRSPRRSCRRTSRPCPSPKSGCRYARRIPSRPRPAPPFVGCRAVPVLRLMTFSDFSSVSPPPTHCPSRTTIRVGPSECFACLCGPNTRHTGQSVQAQPQGSSLSRPPNLPSFCSNSDRILPLIEEPGMYGLSVTGCLMHVRNRCRRSADSSSLPPTRSPLRQWMIPVTS